MQKTAPYLEFDKRLTKVVIALCTSLRFQQGALYVHEQEDTFFVRTTAGFSLQQEEYLRCHPIPTQLITSVQLDAVHKHNFYILPPTSYVWQQPTFAEGFSQEGNAPNAILVPLTSAKQTPPGMLLLCRPYNELELTDEALLFLEVFAEQAAMVIEEERLHKESQQSNEERSALIEISRALVAPNSLRGLQNVYQTIYEQVCKLMPVDAFFISRYNYQDSTMTMDFLIDEGVTYPPFPYASIPLWIDKLLSKEMRTYVFGTAEEYDAFANQNSRTPEQKRRDVFGNARPSQSLLFVPIFYDNELIGVLSAQSYQRHIYTQRHLTLLEEIGIQAGIALSNALLYAKLGEALQEAQKSEQLTNNFLMVASHELRTPLTSVQGYLELLTTYAKTLDNETKQHFVDLASHACEELVLLLGNVMDTSRIDYERMHLQIERVHVRHAFRHIAEILEPAFSMEKRALQMDIDEHLYVQADDLRLRQILLNLVGNALKYAPFSNVAITAASTERVVVEQRLRPAQLVLPITSTASHFVLLGVRDWGTGIVQENMSRLFTKFGRLESAINSMQRGAGLGLYLCRQLAEAMHGQIWAESSGIVGEGTTFFLALPLG